MPINLRQDTNGTYYQWGDHGKKYYFKPHDDFTKQLAFNEALQQGRAMFANSNTKKKK